MSDDKRIGEVLITAEEIAAVVKRMAGELDAVYAGDERVLAVVLLEGARRFADDLFVQMKHDLEVAYIKAKSYLGTGSTGVVEIVGDVGSIFKGRDVLLIDDIYDTGLTLKELRKYALSQGAKSVKSCVLFEKMIEHKQPSTIEFKGMDVEDKFIIGYGLDYNEEFRELPFVAVYVGD